MKTSCPTCGEALMIDSRHDGEEVRCAACGEVFLARQDQRQDTDPFRDTEPRDRSRQADSPPSPRPRKLFNDPPPTHSDGSGWGVGALVLGIISIITWWCPPVGLISGALAVFIGGMGLQSSTRPLAIIGMVLGIAAVTFSLGCGVFYGAAIKQQNDLENAPDGNKAPFFRG